MSQENVEIIERVLASAASGDFETMLSLHDPTWEGFIPEQFPVAGTWRGLDGVRGFVEEWLEAWDEFRLEPEEFLDGGEAVVVVVRYRGKGRGSGIEVTDRWFYAYELRSGKVIRWRLCASRAEALEVA